MVVRDRVATAEQRARALLTLDAAAGAEDTATWKVDFRRAVEQAAEQLDQNPRYRLLWELDRDLPPKTAAPRQDDALYDARSFVRLWHLVSASSTLHDQLVEAFASELHPLLRERDVVVDRSGLLDLAAYVLNGTLEHDLQQSLDDASPDWLQTPDGLPSDNPAAMALLEALTQREFDAACEGVALHDGAQVHALRARHRLWEDRQETLDGTIDYLVDAGILVVKPNDDATRYTLSPRMVAPLMSAKAAGSGGSGFTLLSTLRKTSGDTFKELAKEGAQILFTSATIGLGKLVLEKW